VDSEIVTKITTTQAMSVQDIIDLVTENLKSNKNKREIITRGDCKIYVQKLYDNSKEYVIVSQCQNNGIITSSSYVDFCSTLYSKQMLDSCQVGQISIMKLPSDPIDFTFKFF
ncbi:hypothetical protein, partial [Salmonella sp. s51228]|uniref:hypothetical protein n=1 Tax=Salmonella sp. s51228 TaxID=3159652 RepID=UPI00397F5F86